MPYYRVTFAHARHGTRFEVVVRGDGLDDATVAGIVCLQHRFETFPSHVEDWEHRETRPVEMEPFS